MDEIRITIMRYRLASGKERRAREKMESETKKEFFKLSARVIDMYMVLNISIAISMDIGRATEKNADKKLKMLLVFGDAQREMQQRVASMAELAKCAEDPKPISKKELEDYRAISRDLMEKFTMPDDFGEIFRLILPLYEDPKPPQPHQLKSFEELFEFFEINGDKDKKEEPKKPAEEVPKEKEGGIFIDKVD